MPGRPCLLLEVYKTVRRAAKSGAGQKTIYWLLEDLVIYRTARVQMGILPSGSSERFDAAEAQ